MDRIILHCDLNCFYASVELLSHPDLRQVPVAVCGDPDSPPRHHSGQKRAGQAPAASRRRRPSGRPSGSARTWCCCRLTTTCIAEYSRQVNAIYEEYTDLVEPFGIDESWLDVTGTLHLFGGDAEALADTPAAADAGGAGPDACRWGCPSTRSLPSWAATTKSRMPPPSSPGRTGGSIVWPLPVGTLLYVGRAAARSCWRSTASTPSGQLAAITARTPWRPCWASWAFSSTPTPTGWTVHRCCPGTSGSPSKSVGNSTTFSRDLTTWDQVRTGITVLSDSVAMRLRRARPVCRRRSRWRCADPDFKDTLPAEAVLPAPTHLMRELSEACSGADAPGLESPYPHPDAVTVTAIHLVPESEAYIQLDLLDRTSVPRQREAGEAGAGHGRHPGQIMAGTPFPSAPPERSIEEEPS